MAAARDGLFDRSLTHRFHRSTGSGVSFGPIRSAFGEEAQRVLERRAPRCAPVPSPAAPSRTAPRRRPRVVDALVLVRQLVEGGDGLVEHPAPLGREPVGERQAEEFAARAGRRALDVEHVAADALGLFRLVEGPVLLRLRERRLEIPRAESLQRVAKLIALPPCASSFVGVAADVRSPAKDRHFADRQASPSGFRGPA
jgi:hypothetical protein